GVLGLYRDITQLKQREEALAAAKEAAEAARDAAERARAETAAAQRHVERTFKLMQIVLDNMNAGVLLLDKDFRVQLVNRQMMDFQDYPPDVVCPGASGYDIIRYQVERGDFGPVGDVEAMVRERAIAVQQPGGSRFIRKTASGRYVEFHLN